MSAELLYARFGLRETRIYASSWSDPARRVLVFDVNGDIRTPTLRDRLLSLELSRQLDHVVLRGVSEYLEADILTGDGRRELADRFGSAAVSVVDRTDSRKLQAVVLQGPIDEETARSLLTLSAQAEVEAALAWSNAIWSDSSHHFIVPSGHHADKFVRVAAVFAEATNVLRIADWVEHRAAPPCVLVADTYTLLPLLQEIQLQWMRRARVELPRFILPLYGEPSDSVRDRLAEIVPIARDSGAQILALVSVTATGGYVAALQEGLKSFAEQPALDVCAVCATLGEGPLSLDSALCRIPSKSFPDRASCEMCQVKHSTPIPIDQHHFTTRLGTHVLTLPKAPALENVALVIRDADQYGALRVHVGRSDRHGHLAIFIDTAQLLKSKVFQAIATVGFYKACTGFTPDLVLMPSHDGTEAVRDWITEHTRAPIEVVSEGRSMGDLDDRIRRARRILIVDDAVISGRTLIGLLERVQRAKAAAMDTDYQIRGLILIARPAYSTVWQGLVDRFYINKQYCLTGAWELRLPDIVSGGRNACPWCVELRWLRSALPGCPDSARPYIESRIRRLEDSNGLNERLYLGTENAPEYAEANGWDPSVHTTPGSYLGDLSMWVHSSAPQRLFKPCEMNGIPTQGVGR